MLGERTVSNRNLRRRDVAQPPSQAANLEAAMNSKVTVIHRAMDAGFDTLAGKRVRSVRRALKDVFSIQEHAQALVNGSPVPGDYSLRSGDLLEFTPAGWGKKGALEPDELERFIRRIDSTVKRIAEEGLFRLCRQKMPWGISSKACLMLRSSLRNCPLATSSRKKSTASGRRYARPFAWRTTPRSPRTVARETHHEKRLPGGVVYQCQSCGAEFAADVTDDAHWSLANHVGNAACSPVCRSFSET
jgi:hypothetical protein